MNGDVAQRACLEERRLVMEGRGARRTTETGIGVALQAEQVDIADFQHVGVRPAMHLVARAAPVDLHSGMLVDERPLLLGVALKADGVLRGGSAHLLRTRGAVDVVAIAALNQAFIYAVVERHREFRFLREVAAVAEFGLRLGEKELLRFGVMWRVARDAAHAVLRVDRVQRIHVLRAADVASEAAICNFLRRGLLEEEQLGGIRRIGEVLGG